jgi:hypothetical protein
MSDEHQALLLRLDELRKMVDEATLGPWRVSDSRDHWSLHGEARAFHTTKAKPIVAPSMQILKAPKHGTPYAEYWPNAGDSALITTAVNMFPFWIDWATEVLNRHIPVVCGCRADHFLCGPHRVYQWHECPEVHAVARALGMAHGTS